MDKEAVGMERETVERAVREAGGIVHRDGNIFFTDYRQMQAAMALAQQPAPIDWEKYPHWPIGISDASSITEEALRQALADMVVDQRAQQPAAQAAGMTATIAGALFDLMGYLTTLDEPVTLSARHDAAVAVKLLREWAERRGLSIDGADVEGWQRALLSRAAPSGEIVGYRTQAGNLLDPQEVAYMGLDVTKCDALTYAAPQPRAQQAEQRDYRKELAEALGYPDGLRGGKPIGLAWELLIGYVKDMREYAERVERQAEQPAEEAQHADPCPGCIPGGVCKTPTCGRLKAKQAEPKRDFLNGWREAIQQLPISREGVAPQAAEEARGVDDGEWEALAIKLCEEEGQDPYQLVWSGGPIPEPWGDLWTKYESEAKRMIQLVREFAAPAAGTGQESVEGDVLPPVGADVLIHLARQDEWVPHKVTGYYVWPDLKGNPFLQRVFVRVRDSEGYSNARMLRDVRRLDGTPFVTDKQAATGAQGLTDEQIGTIKELLQCFLAWDKDVRVLGNVRAEDAADAMRAALAASRKGEA